MSRRVHKWDIAGACRPCSVLRKAVTGLAARVARGLSRPQGRDARTLSARRPRAQFLAFAALGALLTILLPGAPRASASPPPARLVLDAQTPWATGTSGVSLSLSVQDATVPSARLALQLTLFAPFGSRSALDASFAGLPTPTSAILDQPSPVPLVALTRVRGTEPVYRLHVRLEASGPPSTPAASPVLQLPCAALASCDGVYPLDLALVDTGTGATLAKLLTYLVVGVVPAGSRPLDVAVVLDLAGPPPLTPAGRPSLARGWLRAAGAILSLLAREPRPALSLLVPGDLLVALESSGERGRLILHALRALSREPSRQLLSPPFAPLDLNALAAAGLGDQLRTDLSLGAAATRHALGTLSTAPIWLSPGAVDSSALALLKGAGLHALVVPSPDTAPTDPMTTPTSPFTALPGPVEVLPADIGLAAHFEGNDPALAPVELAADLTQIYLDAPFSVRPRGVVVTALLGSRPSTAAVIEGDLAVLASARVVRPLTVPSFLADVPPVQSVALAGGVVEGSRYLLTRPLSRFEAIPRSDALEANDALTALKSLDTANAPALLEAQQAVILGESAGVSPSARLAYFGEPRAALAEAARRLRLPSRRTVTLTAMTARIPFTIVSTARHAVRVLVALSSPDLRFPDGRDFPVVLKPGEDTLYLAIGARSSGDFPLSISLLAPAGDVLLARERVTVRSTAISWVAVVLSAAALLLLAGWWLRTSRRRRHVGRRAVAPTGSHAPGARTPVHRASPGAVRRAHSRRAPPAHAAGNRPRDASEPLAHEPRAPLSLPPPGEPTAPLAE